MKDDERLSGSGMQFDPLWRALAKASALAVALTAVVWLAAQTLVVVPGVRVMVLGADAAPHPGSAEQSGAAEAPKKPATPGTSGNSSSQQ